MKHLDVLLALALVFIPMNNIFATDEEGHQLVQDWKQYQKAVKQDLPKEELAILGRIKEKALSSSLPWDFFDASEKYYSVARSINWKTAETEKQSMMDALASCGMPVVRFRAFLMENAKVDSVFRYVSSEQKSLSSSVNRRFYETDFQIGNLKYSKALVQLLPNDYDYCLWSLSCRSDSKKIKDALHSSCGSAYPFSAFLEYSAIGTRGREEALREYFRKYSGKAAALLARDELLGIEYGKLNQKPSSTQEQYRKLASACETLMKEKESYSGKEKLIASCCEEASNILEQLNRKSLDMYMRSDTIYVTFRNLSSADFELKRGESSVLKKKLENQKCSFYVRDTVKLPLPVAMPDGEYKAVVKGADDTVAEMMLEYYSLSFSLRKDWNSYKIFAADSRSGKPLKDYDVEIVRPEKYEGKKFHITGQGFVSLPRELVSIVSDKGEYVSMRVTARSAGGVARSSREYSPYFHDSVRPSAEEDPKRVECLTLLDRKMYTPGETVRFKTILHNGKKVRPGMKDLRARLLDADGKSVGGMALETDAFGSAFGSFEIGRGDKNGNYTLEIRRGNDIIGTQRLMVGDVVMPKLDLRWEKTADSFLAGDRITLPAVIKTYSGHPASSASITYEVRSGSTTIASGRLVPDIEDRVAVTFDALKSQGWHSYSVTVKTVDDTGETRSFEKSVSSMDNISTYVEIANSSDGELRLPDGEYRTLVNDERLDAVFRTSADRGTIKYSLLGKDGKKYSEGSAEAGKAVNVDISFLPSGLYRLEMEALVKADDGTEYRKKSNLDFAKVREWEEVIPFRVLSYFHRDASDPTSVFVASSGKTWLSAEMMGPDAKLLESRIVEMESPASSAVLRKIAMGGGKDRSSELYINLLFFKDDEEFLFGFNTRPGEDEEGLPLSFSRFEDRTRPMSRYTFQLASGKNVQCAATIFDKRSEAFRSNVWNAYRSRTGGELYVPYSCVNGSHSSSNRIWGRAGGGLKLASMRAEESMAMLDGVAVSNSKAMLDNGSVEEAAEAPELRSDFSRTLAWLPAIQTDSDGLADLPFETGGELSTFVVQLFAHDKDMRSSVLRREMVVSIPVKVDLALPLQLCEGDEWTPRISLSNSTGRDVSGRVAVRFYDGKDVNVCPVRHVATSRVVVPAMSSTAFECTLPVHGFSTLGVRVDFVADSASDGSDALFVTVPVVAAEQKMTESHSALLPGGADKDVLVARLRKEFVNVSADKSQLSIRPIGKMLEEALPAEIVLGDAANAVSLTRIYQAHKLMGLLGKESSCDVAMLEKRLRACINADGGFGWFPGMKSSPLVTAVVLEGAYEAISEAQLGAAISYLDRSVLSETASWCSVTLPQYLYIRALHPSGLPDFKGVEAKRLAAFKKDVQNALVPSGARGLNGQILDKARRIRTLQLLSASDEGLRLADRLGIGGQTLQRVTRSMDKDVNSLLQYAVDHVSGGKYYPNAVMPWRGLLESELYAHVMVCRTLDASGNPQASAVADDVRLWLMVQKETQKWGSDPASLSALVCVAEGSARVKDAVVLVLSADYSLPYSDIRAAGNGMRLEVRNFVKRSGNWKELADGDVIEAGDRVRTEYRIWNEENRSFIRLTATRPSCLRPVDQLSGICGGWFGGANCATPGYRSVLADRSEFWFDSYPEENTTVSEEYYAVCRGVFSCAVPVIESLYAPHYRANSDAPAKIRVSTAE